MSLDCKRASLPEICIKCPISWMTCLPRDTQLGGSVERLVEATIWKAPPPFVDIFRRLWMNKITWDNVSIWSGQKFHFRFRFRFMILEIWLKRRVFFWLKRSAADCKSMIESHRVYRTVASDREQTLLPESCVTTSTTWNLAKTKCSGL